MSNKATTHLLESVAPLKLADGAKGNGFLKIDPIQLNRNSEHPGTRLEPW